MAETVVKVELGFSGAGPVLTALAGQALLARRDCCRTPTGSVRFQRRQAGVDCRDGGHQAKVPELLFSLSVAIATRHRHLVFE